MGGVGDGLVTVEPSGSSDVVIEDPVIVPRTLQITWKQSSVYWDFRDRDEIVEPYDRDNNLTWLNVISLLKQETLSDREKAPLLRSADTRGVFLAEKSEAFSSA